MVKGRYACIVEIDFSLDDNILNEMQLDELREFIYNTTEIGLTELIQEDLGKNGKVKVHRQYADVYTEEDKT